jgi:rod shape-determining protein MreD
MALRRAAAAVFIVTALLLQLVAVNRFGLPGGQPNLVLAVVLVLAIVEGPGPGMVYAFLAGLLGDLLSIHTVGRLALAWTVAAYLAGFVSPAERTGQRAFVLPVLAVGVLSGGATIGFAALAVVAGSAHEALRRIVEQAAAVSVYALVLAPFVFLFVRVVLRRLQAVQA